ncbi:Maf family nucleotide pyrophosphatase [Roseivirga misakiensis]|uniref:dTTP/UTP pyrophosphatase n=1 Tax=Roseivirga misakiensis TaxID=1563681 RepID=A0A1E5T1L7_9BACT|nr:Maf family nucleotide pyrophosphatase [Roseivirga misakiensis]OEK05256.1 septum formation protein Maf [Roseivirga misakiensis]
MNLNYHIILASKSPRRQELLRSLGLDFEVQVKSIDESFPPNTPALKVAEFIAQKKSEAFGPLNKDVLLITSDTVVIADGKILGKPKDSSEAFAMISSLSGNTHSVATGVCLRTTDKVDSFTSVTSVSFDALEDQEILHYINTYMPFDKAGSYGIQEWIGMIGINKIEGDFYNVMGLPLNALYKRLKAFK